MPAILTNKHGLPELFEQAAKFDGHIKLGDYSVTELIDSPRVQYLKRNHEYEHDVMDRVWMMLGTGVHHQLERGHNKTRQAKIIYDFFSVLAELSDELDEEKRDKVERMKRFIENEVLSELPNVTQSRWEVEKTLTMDVDGVTISGTRDVKDTHTNIISDYKVTSAYAFMYPENIKKWKAQLNIYRLMEEANGGEVSGLQVICIFKDWRPGDQSRLKKKGYPDQPIKVIDLDMIDRDRMWKYVQKRVAKHEKAHKEEVPYCSPDEMWSESDSYAVKKEGADKALRVLPDKEAAEEYMRSVEHKYKGYLYVEHRPGTNKRCERFCEVARFCDQYKKYHLQKYGTEPTYE